jgi:glycolate dehydrogenase iron-sulfur subunit
MGPNAEDHAGVPDHVACEHCGRCLQVCPAYLATQVETFSPRGRSDLIAAVEAGALTPGPRFEEALHKCVNCLACTAICPKGVDVAGQVLAVRIRKGAASGHHRLKHLLFKLVLSHRAVLAKLVRAAAALQPLFPRAQGSRLRHFPLFLPEMLRGRTLPLIDERSLFQQFPEVNPAAADVPHRGEVVYFSGCYHGLVETSAGAAAIRVLSANGFDVRLPREQTCCGMPVMLSGDLKTARDMAAKNVAGLAASTSVVTTCATCGSMLRRHYPQLLSASPETVSAQIGQVLDVTEFLGRLPHLRPGQHEIRLTVTVHDPCHLSRGQGVRDPVRRVLATIPGLQIVEMAAPEECCGGSGLFSVEEHELSRKIGTRKIEQILVTGASTVVTGCPGCILQIRDLLHRQGTSIAVFRPVELLAASYGYPPPGFGSLKEDKAPSPARRASEGRL